MRVLILRRKWSVRCRRLLIRLRLLRQRRTLGERCMILTVFSARQATKGGGMS